MNYNTLMLHGVICWELIEVQTIEETGVKYQRFIVKTNDGEFSVNMFFESSAKTDHETNNI